MTACRAPIRTCAELYGSATSAWVKVRALSELMGPSSAGFALWARAVAASHFGVGFALWSRRPELQMTCSCRSASRSGTSSRGCLFKSHGGGLAKSLGGTRTPHHTAHARRWPCLAVAVSVFTPGKPEIRAHVTYHRFRDVIRPVELLNAHDRRRKAQRAAEGRSARASSQVVEWGCQSGRSRVVPGGRGSRAARSRATTRTGGSRGKARGCRRSRRAGAVGSTPGGEGGYIRLSLSRLPPVVANHRNVEN